MERPCLALLIRGAVARWLADLPCSVTTRFNSIQFSLCSALSDMSIDGDSSWPMKWNELWWQNDDDNDHDHDHDDSDDDAHCLFEGTHPPIMISSSSSSSSSSLAVKWCSFLFIVYQLCASLDWLCSWMGTEPSSHSYPESSDGGEGYSRRRVCTSWIWCGKARQGKARTIDFFW